MCFSVCFPKFERKRNSGELYKISCISQLNSEPHFSQSQFCFSETAEVSLARSYAFFCVRFLFCGCILIKHCDH